MARKNAYIGSALAALVAFVCVVIFLAASSGLPAGVLLQPYGASSEQVLSGITQYLDKTLLFFGTDTVFPISYLLVFVGLYVVTVDHNRWFAVLGMGTGILTALFDLSENAFFISYALMIRNGVTVGEAAVTFIYVLTTLKWAMAFATFYAFGLAFPRGKWFEWVIVILMLIFPLFGAVSTANPDLIPLRSLFMLGGMAALGLYFVYRYRSEPTGAA